MTSSSSAKDVKQKAAFHFRNLSQSIGSEKDLDNLNDIGSSSSLKKAPVKKFSKSQSKEDRTMNNVSTTKWQLSYNAPQPSELAENPPEYMDTNFNDDTTNLPSNTNEDNIASKTEEEGVESLPAGSDAYISQGETSNYICKKIKQRECSTYIGQSKNEKKEICGCGRSKEEHTSVSSAESTTWNYKKHAASQKCDSFGKIEFIGVGSKTTTALYSRIDCDTKCRDVWELMITHWKMTPPKLLISVTGGAQKFELKPRLSSLLKLGLVGAAVNTGAWLITGGTASGVMEFVGEAVKHHMTINGSGSDDACVALGIATWGIVKNNESLSGFKNTGAWPASYKYEDEKNSKCLPLDPNHTHFLLVDDGTVNKFGVEIEFRSKLERFIAKQKAPNQDIKIPVVLIVVEGGFGTMKTVEESVKNGIPVVIVKGSGRAADLLASVFELKAKNNLDNPEEEIKKCFDTKDTPEDRRNIENCKAQLKSCFKKPYLINIFDLEKCDSVKDIDLAILRALLKANQSECKAQLGLALAWNKCEDARKHIFISSNRSKWKMRDLYDAMFVAIVQDKPDFVQLFLDNGVELKKFLNIQTLWKLYHSCLNMPDSIEAAIVKGELKVQEQSLKAYLTCRSLDDWKDLPKETLLYSINKVIIRLLKDDSYNFYFGEDYHVQYNSETNPMHWEGDEKIIQRNYNPKSNSAGTVKIGFEYPERDLFILAVIFNRKKMADLFLKLGVDQIGTSLVGSSILKGLSKRAENSEETALSISYNEHSQILERFAINVLSECYQRNKVDAQTLLFREMKQLGGVPVLLLVERQELMDFAEHPACQTKLASVWKGDLSPQTSQFRIFASIILPFLIPFMKFIEHSHKIRSNQVAPSTCLPNKRKLSLQNNTEAKPNTSREVRVGCVNDGTKISLTRAIHKFYSAPVTKFSTNIISYIIFLGLFSFFLLTNVRPVTLEDSPSVVEFVVYAWFATMFIEEIRQVWAVNQVSPKFKFMRWWSNTWNVFDLIMYFAVILSIILRFNLNEETFLGVRIVYSITLILAYLRFMQFFFAEPHMGPKVIMIRRMLTDLLFFFFILVVFILSFGVGYHVNMFPNQPVSWSILANVVKYPYFQIYGELFLDDLKGKNDGDDGCTKNETIWRENLSLRCPETNPVVYIFLSLYLVLTNILLINLLIAMFSYTFQRVQDNSTKVWRFHRISLVNEYFDRPTLAPPIIILNHIWRIIGHFYPCVIIGERQKFGMELSQDANNRLRLFEKAAVDTYLAQKFVNEREFLDNRVATTAERLEHLMADLQMVKEYIQRNQSLCEKCKDTS